MGRSKNVDQRGWSARLNKIRISARACKVIATNACYPRQKASSTFNTTCRAGRAPGRMIANKHHRVEKPVTANRHRVIITERNGAEFVSVGSGQPLRRRLQFDAAAEPVSSCSSSITPAARSSPRNGSCSSRGREFITYRPTPRSRSRIMGRRARACRSGRCGQCHSIAQPPANEME